jgi:signal transduction histidine kinase
MQDSEPSPNAKPARFSSIEIALLLILVTYQVLSATSIIGTLRQPSSGWTYWITAGANLKVEPTTAEAMAAAKQIPRPLFIVTINGNMVGGGVGGAARSAETDVAKFLNPEYGATNHFRVAGADGIVHTLSLRVAKPTANAFTQSGRGFITFLYHLTGLLYLFIGLFVRWRRPSDPSARSLLLLAIVAGMSTADVYAVDQWTLLLLAFNRFATPFYGVAGFHLGTCFTGQDRQPRVLLTTRILLCLAIITGFGLAASCLQTHSGASLWPWVETVLLVSMGAQMIVASLAAAVLCFHAARNTQVPAQRRRARWMGIAICVAFVFPSLWQLMRPLVSAIPILVPTDLVQWFALTAFPIVIGLGILRHRLFDLRIVLRQGLVYALLSLLITFIYTAIILSTTFVLGERSQSPYFIGALVLVITLALSMLKLRVQRLVDRLVNSSRHTYVKALSEASAALARARSLDAAKQAVSVAFVGGMKLTRVALAIRSTATASTMDCEYLCYAGIDPELGQVSRLPRVIDPSHYEPTAHLLGDTSIPTIQASTMLPRLASHRHPTPTPSGATTTNRAPTFWTEYGFEEVVPLILGEVHDSQVHGVLYLGPRTDRREFDNEDRRLIFTLANQVALAIENSTAFAALNELKNNLEVQVGERTHELSTALDDLHETQAQLVEAESQGLLTRFVAGVVHEVNSPLGALKSGTDTLSRATTKAQAELAKETIAPERLARTLKAAGAAVENMETAQGRISTLLQGLQRFVSLDEAELKPLSLVDSLDNSLNLLAPQISESVDIQRNYCKEELRVMCFPARLNQVFLGLLQNAVDALSAGQVLNLSIDKCGDMAQVEIRDTGKGIPEEALGQLFDFGFTQKQGRVGLRLGLPVAKRAIESLSGTIELESKEGEGTTVRVRLPLVK